MVNAHASAAIAPNAWRSVMRAWRTGVRDVFLDGRAVTPLAFPPYATARRIIRP
jgi:hypothetical protein